MISSRRRARVAGLAAGLLLALCAAAVLANEPPPADEPAQTKQDPIGAADRAALEAFVTAHIEHANSGDLEAYLADFISDHNDAARIRAYSERLLLDSAVQIELVELEVMVVRRDTAKVRAVQRTRWTDEQGRARLDQAQLNYSLRRVGDAWRIVGTTRERVY